MRRSWIGPLVFAISHFALSSAAGSEGNSTSHLVWDDHAGLTTLANCNPLSPSSSLVAGSFADWMDSWIEVQDLSSSTTAGNAPFPLVGSWWKTASAGQNMKAIRCLPDPNSGSTPARDFVVFEVRTQPDAQPLALVGVANPAASVFRSIRLHSLSEGNDIEKESAPTEDFRMQTASAMTGDVEAFDGSLDYVACLSSSSRLNVRDQSLSEILFTVPAYQTLLPVQSFGTDRIQTTIGGKTYDFIKVQFPDLSSSKNTGWVAETFVKLRSQCSGAPTGSVDNSPIKDSAWTFPLLQRTTDSYKTGMRAFGASRSGGRRHAAADLYRKDGDSILAVASGRIIRDRYYFYQGTYAIEAQHTGGKVVRYGEIKGKAAPNVADGKSISAGQVVGYMGTVNSGCCKPMLHFEMYSGTASGPLTQASAKPYNRRKDLLNPTESLSTWEKAKFGTSY